MEVHVVLRWGAPLVAAAEAVRRSLTALGASTVNVVVEDHAVRRLAVRAAKDMDGVLSARAHIGRGRIPRGGRGDR